jgi:hypothetical protein
VTKGINLTQRAITTVRRLPELHVSDALLHRDYCSRRQRVYVVNARRVMLRPLLPGGPRLDSRYSRVSRIGGRAIEAGGWLSIRLIT